MVLRPGSLPSSSAARCRLRSRTAILAGVASLGEQRASLSSVPSDLDAAPTISVVIPALNEAERIADAVARARAIGATEVLVADGGSGDATVAKARDAGAEVCSGRRGRAVQQNLAAGRARGDVLLFLHADTWLAPEAGGQIRAALGDPQVLGGAFRQQIEARGLLYRLLERGNAFRARWRGSPYGDQGIFIRREVFVELGGFDEVQLMEDVLLMRRFRRRAHPVLLEGPLHVSPRRWQRYGVVLQTWRNWLLLAAERLGVPPDRLARLYPGHWE